MRARLSGGGDGGRIGQGGERGVSRGASAPDAVGDADAVERVPRHDQPAMSRKSLADGSYPVEVPERVLRHGARVPGNLHQDGLADGAEQVGKLTADDVLDFGI